MKKGPYSPVCFSLLLALTVLACNRPATDPFHGWRVAGGTRRSTHYSSLDQIDTSNVNQLQPAWIYHTGDADTQDHSQIECNPIIVHGILYATSPTLILFALNAATGRQLWTFNPRDSGQNHSLLDFILNNNRGVTYWEHGSDRRILYTAGSYLYEIHALSGTLVRSFGNGGRVDLHDGLGGDMHKLYVAATSPGVIFKNLLILGDRVSEESDAAPGYIRAYDVRSGRIRWVFHTIPQPGETGYTSWEDPIAWKHIGGANCWSGLSLDKKRGWVFAATGSASFDFYGGRRKGKDLFADCILALDAASGKLIWYYQGIHHDVWDKDFPAPPALVTLDRKGRKVDAVAQITKTGYIFLLDRQTGKPFYPIPERLVPTRTELKGEEIWPTQPMPDFPTPFMRQNFQLQDLDTLLPDSSYQDIKRRFLSYHTGNMFNPMSHEGTVVFPGLDGGGEWGGPAFDPKTGLLYVNANQMPWVITIADVSTRAPRRENYLQAGIRLYRTHCMTCHGPERKGSGNYPSLLGVERKYNLSSLVNLISTGRRMMPGFRQLSLQKKQALASFILGIKKLQTRPFTGTVQPADSFLNLPYSITGYNKFVSSQGYPAINPPWGTLAAINLHTGRKTWEIPLGDYPEFLARGIRTGTENYGGPVVTSGGLLFIAASRDGMLRAFNKRTGTLLWQYRLPFPGFATPSVYQAGGREYVVIACGGGKLGTPSGDSYLAFCLK